ncbi:hypothetical protein ACFL3H_08480 [Gemmatimonadota bacterium]
MSPEVREIRNRRDLKEFICLPEKIHAGRQNWVHSLYRSDRHYFDPRKNHTFSYCDTIRLLAFDGDEPVGRVMGIINSRYNQTNQVKTARWGFLEVYDNDDRQEVIHALLSRVEAWAREAGMELMVGPYGFTNQDPVGLMYEGFGHRATIATYYNFEWMPGAVENEGYSKEIDYVVFRIDVPDKPPEVFEKVVQRILKRGEYELVELRKISETRAWVKPIFSLMNDIMGNSEIYGYSALDEVEMDSLARKYLRILDPRFIKIVLKDSKPVAFFISMPDISRGIQQARGRFLPFGILKIWKARRETKQLDLLIGGVLEEYRGKGLDAYMGISVVLAALEAGMTLIDTHHELENNLKVQAEMKRQGGEVYKRYRLYRKTL